MDTNTIDTVRNMVHGTSIVLLAIILVIVIVGLFKPQLVKKIFREFSERKYIVTAGVFIGLLSGTVFLATQPVDNSYVSRDTNQAVRALDSIRETQNTTQETIKTEEVNVVESVAYTAKQQADPSLPVGQTKLTQAGKNGQKQLTYLVTYHRDTEVSRELKAEEVITQPTAEITAVGSLAPAPPAPKKDSRSLIQFSCKKNDADNSKNPHICFTRN
ncbi:MAG: G5 domain-containing protein [Candidatus Saccharimonadales bacterium]